MLAYLQRTPQVRDVVVSGGDVANMPWKNLEGFLDQLLEIDNIRDIRLATKALMGLPQHWLQPTTSSRAWAACRAKARARGVSLAIHTHVNNAQSVTPLVAAGRRRRCSTPACATSATRACSCAASTTRPSSCSTSASRCRTRRSITPYYFYMCDMIPFAEHWRLSLAEAQHLQHSMMGYLPGFATPRIVCDVPFVGKRWVHQVDSYDTERGISYWRKNYRTSIEGADDRGAVARVRLLRPDLHAARGGPAVVARVGATTSRSWPRPAERAATSRAAAESQLVP